MRLSHRLAKFLRELRGRKRSVWDRSRACQLGRRRDTCAGAMQSRGRRRGLSLPWHARSASVSSGGPLAKRDRRIKCITARKRGSFENLDFASPMPPLGSIFLVSRFLIRLFVHSKRSGSLYMPFHNPTDDISNQVAAKAERCTSDFLKMYLLRFANQHNNILEVRKRSNPPAWDWKEFLPYVSVSVTEIETGHRLEPVLTIDSTIINRSLQDEVRRFGYKYGNYEFIVIDSKDVWPLQVMALESYFPFVARDGALIVTSLSDEIQDPATTSFKSLIEMWSDFIQEKSDDDWCSVENKFLRDFGITARSIKFGGSVCIIEKPTFLPRSPTSNSRGTSQPPDEQHRMRHR